MRSNVLPKKSPLMDRQWSPSEKKAARQTFDLAVANAQKDILKRHSDKEISTADDLWRYELEIREWRKEVQNTLQFTYSSLPICFGLCLRKGWLVESDFVGLCDERIEQIKSIASVKQK
jgi:hypothetical protein